MSEKKFLYPMSEDHSNVIPNGGLNNGNLIKQPLTAGCYDIYDRITAYYE
jgi:hypothetical protein